MYISVHVLTIHLSTIDINVCVCVCVHKRLHACVLVCWCHSHSIGSLLPGGHVVHIQVHPAECVCQTLNY